MAIQSDETLVTKGDLKTLYTDKILPYLGGNMMMQTGVSDYYSEDEKVVGIWTDGKPVYQKTIVTNTGSSGIVTYSIASWNIDKVINYNGVIEQIVNEKYYYPNIFYNADSTYHCNIYLDRDNNKVLNIGVGSGYYNYDIYITIQYTKITDTATSALTTPGCYDINRPDLWPANQEIFFGNGLYGSRLIGNATLELGVRQDIILTGSITNNTRLISQGGQLRTPNNWSLPLTMSFSLTYEVSRMEAFIFPLYTEGKLKMYMLVNNPNDVGTYNYDVWVTYTK